MSGGEEVEENRPSSPPASACCCQLNKPDIFIFIFILSVLYCISFSLPLPLPRYRTATAYQQVRIGSTAHHTDEGSSTQRVCETSFETDPDSARRMNP